MFCLRQRTTDVQGNTFKGTTNWDLGKLCFISRRTRFDSCADVTFATPTFYIIPIFKPKESGSNVICCSSSSQVTSSAITMKLLKYYFLNRSRCNQLDNLPRRMVCLRTLYSTPSTNLRLSQPDKNAFTVGLQAFVTFFVGLSGEVFFHLTIWDMQSSFSCSCLICSRLQESTSLLTSAGCGSLSFSSSTLLLFWKTGQETVMFQILTGHLTIRVVRSRALNNTRSRHGICIGMITSSAMS